MKPLNRAWHAEQSLYGQDFMMVLSRKLANFERDMETLGDAMSPRTKAITTSHAKRWG